ncbi:MAG: hypothetical protein HFJ09_01160 [Lachnospiraceae bacterium]|nr:hypothetical protein [Lachnospiraceae bacterium]
MSNRGETAIEQIVMEWKKIAQVGLEESRQLLLSGFGGHAGEIYRSRLENIMEVMKDTANRLWEGRKL